MIPSEVFGSNSDGGIEMSLWLEQVCRGCVKDRGRHTSGEPGEEHGGMACALPVLALVDPHEDRPEWSTDNVPVREQELARAHEIVPAWCSAYRARKRRSDAGRSRTPGRAHGQDALFAP